VNEPLEDRLRRLKPRSPSKGLDNRMAALFAVGGAPASVATPWWAALAAAVAALVLGFAAGAAWRGSEQRGSERPLILPAPTVYEVRVPSRHFDLSPRSRQAYEVSILNENMI